MSREIKFRAWDGILEKMVNWEDFHHELMLSLSDRAYHVMQFTGLYDKNGKPIYEGDILESVSEKIRIRDNKPTGKFSTKRFTIEYQAEFARFQRKALGSATFELLPSNSEIYTTWIEVIGNIHENPELMGVE